MSVDVWHVMSRLNFMAMSIEDDTKTVVTMISKKIG